VQHLSPAYFALVMATGIVSIAAWDFQLTILALALFAFNLAAFAVLVVLTVLRAIRYPRAFVADMTDHQVGPGFFTVVAGCCILGTQFWLLTHNVAAATALLVLGTVAWIGLT
jgi:tellurite resistance protein TehA-like permease